MDAIQEIKNIILKEMYNFGFDSFYRKNLRDILSNYKGNQILRAILNMDENKIIRIFNKRLDQREEIITDFKGHITDKGVLKYECYDFKDDKYSIEIARFLQVVEQAEQNSIGIDEIVPKIIDLGSIKTPIDLRNFLQLTIQETCIVQKDIGPENYTPLKVYAPYSCIKPYGNEILKKFRTSIDIFKKPFLTNRDLILEDYLILDVLIENFLWKDACIKMGSILEYIITKWLIYKGYQKIEYKAIPTAPLKKEKIEKSQLWQKIPFYLSTAGSAYSYEIGNDTNWNIVDKIFRKYRNYIHLHEYEKRVNDIGRLEKDDYEQLYTSFKKIVSKC